MSGLARSLPMKGRRRNVPKPTSLSVIASTTDCRSPRGEIVLGQVEPVLADAQVDQRARPSIVCFPFSKRQPCHCWQRACVL